MYDRCMTLKYFFYIIFFYIIFIYIFLFTIKYFFRFYFKTEVDGDMCYEEETEDSSLVPLWEGKILVQCHPHASL